MCLWYALGTLVFAFRPDAISDIDYEFTTYTPHAQFTQMMSNPQHYYCLKSNILYFKQETSHSNIHGNIRVGKKKQVFGNKPKTSVCIFRCERTNLCFIIPHVLFPTYEFNNGFIL